MSSVRFEVLREIYNKKPIFVDKIERRSEIFGENVFNQAAMRQYVSEEAYQNIKNATEFGKKIERKQADHIAIGMKNWAVAKGATHYTHWFQPLTGATAEKHEAFFSVSDDHIPLEKFDGEQLVQQEPDAASFPSGGNRNMFEARGYTAWDPTSPAFIYNGTLCIPTIFVSYTGEALDTKTPLLKALNAIDEAATEVAKYFDKAVERVNATLGWEQEFFLLDKTLVHARPDLLLAGRTLLGHVAVEGQHLGDHYFGSIPDRVIGFLRELEIECMRLGIPVKTRHNEVAPNQFELAPIHEEANRAVDHNSLIMDVMDKIADKHQFKVLFHEKPFQGVNGSGKHNNWSLTTNEGVNLLSPGSTPMKNLQFLTFFINTIKAVHDYEELLRASVATAGNDHRLGSNEAPPAIISVFIGDQLTKVLDELEGVSKGKLSPQEKTELKLNVIGKIPDVLLDNTDRNRTSAFAFTGSKFEFRAVGAKSNCGSAMTVLNTIVAKQLHDFKKEVDALIDKKGLKKDEAIFNILREYIKASKKIRFEGDGYSVDWVQEAKRRGLSHHSIVPEALKVLLQKKTATLYKEMKVFNEAEIKARYEIELLDYARKLHIESQVLYEMAHNMVIPAALRYQNVLIENVQGLKEVFGATYRELGTEQLNLIEHIANSVKEIRKKLLLMNTEAEKAKKITDVQKCAEAYGYRVKAYTIQIRELCDGLERIVADDFWPLLKFRELLFSK
ncbi:glutamine synthetase III family protein [Neptunitalea lumnitzerae]|uniref:Glutamine synthetase n=1 Tax=Neptunitalea lumnitzerae TaxID=2965509 RepID=A0ABQ5MKT1_9FLAO|nr:glutamine synthetase III [Neptunitalea sp. Y10]GLB50020.1 glutamine synthetase [Neptunitalea sp. Y10]